MQSASRQSPEVRRAVRNAILSAIVGTAVEWYDYYLYATAAATLFNTLFFPSYDHLTGTLLAYASFAIGFFVRPAGSVLFGRLGDRIGRKKVLIITLLLMGGSTTLMGLLPTYAAIGVWAPVLLCVLRALQGLGSGAEYAGRRADGDRICAAEAPRPLWVAALCRRRARLADVARDVPSVLEPLEGRLRGVGLAHSVPAERGGRAARSRAAQLAQGDADVRGDQAARTPS